MWEQSTKKKGAFVGGGGGEELGGGTTDMRDKLGFICKTLDSNIFA